MNLSEQFNIHLDLMSGARDEEDDGYCPECELPWDECECDADEDEEIDADEEYV